MEKKEIVRLKKGLSQLPCIDNVECFLLYGSIFKKKRSDIKDTDIIIVLKDIRRNVDGLFCYIFKNFPNPDFHVYDVKEIERGTAFLTREYVMEYLSDALCLYGTNPFIKTYNDVSRLQYRRSVLIRSIEHVQMTRKVFYSKRHHVEYKLTYLRKYIVRLAKNLILFKGISSHAELDGLAYGYIMNILQKNGMLEKQRRILGVGEAALQANYDLFCSLSSNLIQCKEELDRALELPLLR
ncbi:MAG: hypothetical protein WCK01_02560 [Candidatus Uhrbacteria bacterium]